MSERPMAGSGWYTDPGDPRNERYFDGRKWTDHVRKDVPDIPLAPWVDPRTVPSINGLVIDQNAPTSNMATWVSLALATAGVAAAFLVGFTQTNAGLQQAEESLPGIAVEDPPRGGSGTPLFPLFSCNDLTEAMLQFDAESPYLGVTGIAGQPSVLFDNQPIYVLPDDPSTVYRIMGCQVDAQFADGDTDTVEVHLFTDWQGGLQIDYALF